MRKTDLTFLVMLGICASILIFHVACFMVPVSAVVQYHDIYPAERIVKIGEHVKIPMISKATIHYPVRLDYNDIIRCDDAIIGDRWNYHDHQTSKNQILLPSDGPFESPWSLYTHFTEADIGKTCYVEHNTVAHWKAFIFQRQEPVPLNQSYREVTDKHFFKVVK